MGEVWESSSTKGGARLVLLALADFANDDGYCHPSVERLAVKSALTERNIQLILRDLESRGELVTLRGAGRGHVNTYWVLPPGTVLRLRLEGKTAKTFHPFAALEEKAKSATEWVKTSAQKAKSTAEKVKPASPRTVKNPQEPSRTNTRLEDQTRGKPPVKQDQNPRTPQSGSQPSSADRATPGTAHRSAKGSALGAARKGTARHTWAAWLASNAPPDWLEPDPWARWLRDLDERGVRVTAGRLEEQLKRLQELQARGETQAEIVARAIAGGWVNFYPPREPPGQSRPSESRPDDRYGRYR